MKEYLVFDWGGTFLKYAVMNEETEILEQGRVPAPSRYGTKEEFLAVIDSVVNPYRERISVSERIPSEGGTAGTLWDACLTGK